MKHDFVSIRGRSLPRRMVLQGIASLLGGGFAPHALAATAKSCRLTERDIIGPFYRFGAPFQTKLAVSDRRQRDHTYFAPLWQVANGEDDMTLASFMHELRTRDITNWKPEQAARNAALHAARHKLVTLLRRRATI